MKYFVLNIVPLFECLYIYIYIYIYIYVYIYTLSQKNDTTLRMYIFVIYTPNLIIFCLHLLGHTENMPT